MLQTIFILGLCALSAYLGYKLSADAHKELARRDGEQYYRELQERSAVTAAERQKQEDERYFWEYAQTRLKSDRNKIMSEYMSVMANLSMNPSALEGIDDDTLIQNMDEYYQYRRKAIILEMEGFLLREKEYAYLKDCKLCQYISIPPVVAYIIYDVQTAEYNGPNKIQKLEAEFLRKYGY